MLEILSFKLEYLTFKPILSQLTTSHKKGLELEQLTFKLVSSQPGYSIDEVLTNIT